MIPEWNDLVAEIAQRTRPTAARTNNFPDFTGRRLCPACEPACVGINQDRRSSEDRAGIIDGPSADGTTTSRRGS